MYQTYLFFCSSSLPVFILGAGSSNSKCFDLNSCPLPFDLVNSFLCLSNALLVPSCLLLFLSAAILSLYSLFTSLLCSSITSSWNILVNESDDVRWNDLFAASKDVSEGRSFYYYNKMTITFYNTTLCFFKASHTCFNNR